MVWACEAPTPNIAKAASIPTKSDFVRDIATTSSNEDHDAATLPVLC
jgi:hypothetical protein